MFPGTKNIAWERTKNSMHRQRFMCQKLRNFLKFKQKSSCFWEVEKS